MTSEQQDLYLSGSFLKSHPLNEVKGERAKRKGGLLIFFRL